MQAEQAVTHEATTRAAALKKVRKRKRKEREKKLASLSFDIDEEEAEEEDANEGDAKKKKTTMTIDRVRNGGFFYLCFFTAVRLSCRARPRTRRWIRTFCQVFISLLR